MAVENAAERPEDLVTPSASKPCAEFCKVADKVRRTTLCDLSTHSSLDEEIGHCGAASDASVACPGTVARIERALYRRLATERCPHLDEKTRGHRTDEGSNGHRSIEGNANRVIRNESNRIRADGDQAAKPLNNGRDSPILAEKVVADTNHGRACGCCERTIVNRCRVLWVRSSFGPHDCAKLAGHERPKIRPSVRNNEA